MGLIWPDVGFLLTARRLGVSFESSLTLGRQNLICTPDDIRRGFREAGERVEQPDVEYLGSTGAAEPFLEYLGATSTESLDASDFEGSSLIADLNHPLPEGLHGRFSLVLDAGTLEHIFNVPEALRGCMAAVRSGGHFVSITPANSFLGHGFYQFSPELFYRVLTPANGFEVTLMLSRSMNRVGRWFEVMDPAVVGARVEATGAWPSSLYVIAKRVGTEDIFSEWPQQSDYVAAWGGSGHPPGNSAGSRAIASLPTPARQAVRLGKRLAGTHSGPGHWRRTQLIDLRRSLPAPTRR